MKHPVIDAHLHLDESIPGSAKNAAERLNCELAEHGVSRAIVLHLGFQRWPVEEVAEAVASQDRLVGFINVHPHDKDSQLQLRRGIEKLGFIGLKLHPRRQHHAVDDENTIRLVRFAGELHVPVIICGFPDGDWLMQGSTALSYARLAKACPDTRIVVAHMGGHHVLDMMMLAKRLPNVYFDTSYSLLYYRGSGMEKTLVYAMRSMRFQRVFYGSDYPDRAIGDTQSQSLEIMRHEGLDDTAVEKIMYRNAKEFFGWNDI